MPFKTGLTFTYDCGEFAANMDAAAKLADLDGFPARRMAAKARGKLRGIGLCNPIEVSGGPYTKPAKDMTRLEIAADGSATLISGSMSVGQGHETVFPALVAAQLGIPADRIVYRRGDTDLIAGGRDNGGSSGLCTGGSSVTIVVRKMIEKARALAADQLEVAPQDIEFARGRFTVVGTDRSTMLEAVAARVGGLVETGDFLPEKVNFPNGCHICEVEIDPDTGMVDLVGYTCVEEVGRVINAALLEGQIHGGLVQGIGQILHEQIVHDRDSGQLLAGSFMDYQMPRAGDFPPFVITTREVPTSTNPLGAKGAGEAGTVGSMAATINAVCDALAPLGVVNIDMPATPGRVWEAIRRASQNR
jgi:carbon-monoxide dehydrogenase large subunit